MAKKKKSSRWLYLLAIAVAIGVVVNGYLKSDTKPDFKIPFFSKKKLNHKDTINLRGWHILVENSDNRMLKIRYGFKARNELEIITDEAKFFLKRRPHRNTNKGFYPFGVYKGTWKGKFGEGRVTFGFDSKDRAEGRLIGWPKHNNKKISLILHKGRKN
jgi:hypothetical protein